MLRSNYLDQKSHHDLHLDYHIFPRYSARTGRAKSRILLVVWSW
jgi:hypothetical protein